MYHAFLTFEFSQSDDKREYSDQLFLMVSEIFQNLMFPGLLHMKVPIWPLLVS